MSNVIKNGVIDTRALKAVTYNANIENSINELNRMFSDGHWGWFSICTISSITSRFRNGLFSDVGSHYEYLRSFHCADWRNITKDARESLGIVIVAYLRVPEIGYDCDADKFIDLRFNAASERVSTVAKQLSGPVAEDVAVVTDSWWTKIKRVFKWK